MKKRKKGRRCRQTQCGYFKLGGCKPCSSCKSKPFIINTECARCLRCESVSECLRWDDETQQGEQQREVIETPNEQQPNEPEGIIIIDELRQNKWDSQ